MSIPILAAFKFEPFLVFLIWAVMLVMNLWMFQKTKSKGNLFMMIGAGCIGLGALIVTFSSWESLGKFEMFWLPFFGAILLVAGFYMTAKPVVDVHIEALKKKLQEATTEKKGEEQGEEKADDGTDA